MRFTTCRCGNKARQAAPQGELSCGGEAGECGSVAPYMRDWDEVHSDVKVRGKVVQLSNVAQGEDANHILKPHAGSTRPQRLASIQAKAAQHGGLVVPQLGANLGVRNV